MYEADRFKPLKTQIKCNSNIGRRENYSTMCVF